jgi:Arc/MetJ-type ribon-helix-helix transcriptional regulator
MIMRSIPNRAIDLFFIGLLLRVPSSASDAVRDSLSRWEPGRRLELVLNNGEKVNGRLAGLRPDTFILKSDKRGGPDRELRFDEIRSAKTKMTTGGKWAIAGAVYGVLLVMGLILGK